MQYSKAITLTALSAVGTVANCSLAALDAGVKARHYYDQAYAHYDRLFLGDEAVARYETIGYAIGTALGVAAVLFLNGVDALQAWVDATVEDAQGDESDPADCLPQSEIDIPAPVVFVRLMKDLVYDIYSLFTFIGEVAEIACHYLRGRHVQI